MLIVGENRRFLSRHNSLTARLVSLVRNDLKPIEAFPVNNSS